MIALKKNIKSCCISGAVSWDWLKPMIIFPLTSLSFLFRPLICNQSTLILFHAEIRPFWWQKKMRPNACPSYQFWQNCLHHDCIFSEPQSGAILTCTVLPFFPCVPSSSFTFSLSCHTGLSMLISAGEPSAVALRVPARTASQATDWHQGHAALPRTRFWDVKSSYGNMRCLLMVLRSCTKLLQKKRHINPNLPCPLPASHLSISDGCSYSCRSLWGSDCTGCHNGEHPSRGSDDRDFISLHSGHLSGVSSSYVLC